MSRILLFGATGYTGDLTARSLVAAGATPVLVGRNAPRLGALADELGGLDVAIADASDTGGIRRLLEPGDVLISTVGPFLEHGRAAVQAAAEAGAHYVDSTGEGPFIREVFDTWGPVAERNGAVLLSAFGYDFAPGAYAAGLALDAAGQDADAVDIAYFSFGFTDGRLRSEPIGAHTERFTVDGRRLLGVTVPAAEHLGLPLAYPRLRDIRVMLAFPERAGRAARLGARVVGPLARVGPIERLIRAVAGRTANGSTGGPDADARANSSAVVIARARRGERRLAEVTLRGPNPYDITADLLAWGAMTLAERNDIPAGAHGPVDAFGLDLLGEGCRRAGLERES